LSRSFFDEPIVERWHDRGGQFCAGLGESLGTHGVYQLCLLTQMTEELAEFSLHALAHVGEHERHQGWQGSLRRR